MIVSDSHFPRCKGYQSFAQKYIYQEMQYFNEKHTFGYHITKVV